MRRCMGFLLLWFCLTTQAFADTRVALVIGNSDYGEVGYLPNPRGDAALVADTLEAAGFKVTLVQDAKRATMVGALKAFAETADQADQALVYYAGHGIEVGGINYLLPIDARLRTDRDAEDEGVTLDRVLQTIRNARKLKIVILDACRNNPFADKMKRSLLTRDLKRGLAPPDTPAGILVVYAAEAGYAAADGAGPHSPFTAALARRMREPGLEMHRLFDVVTLDVLEASGNHQRPYQYGSNPSREAFYFMPPATSVATPSDEIWRYLKTSRDVKALKAFLDGLPPDSGLRRDVVARIEELRSPTTQEPDPKPIAIPAAKPNVASDIGKPSTIVSTKPKLPAHSDCFTYGGDKICR